MPHYKDGTKANVGDLVAGRCYNTPGRIVGVVTSVTEGAETCNARVAISLREVEDGTRRIVIPGTGEDYTEVKNLDLVFQRAPA